MGRAVVLGGSVAGLLAARVLADHADEVVIIDRDDLRDGPEPRRGTPQSQHTHALLARGREILDELLPGFTQQMVARGAATGDMLNDCRLVLGGHRFVRTHSDLLVVGSSRALLEDQLRRRVLSHTRIRVGPPADALALAATAGGGHVTGVRVLRRADSSPEETVSADLVVDATGRGSSAPRWLEALGRPIPQDEHLGVEVWYATRRYRARRDDLDGDLATIQAPQPGRPRGGALSRIEADQWLATLVGLGSDRPSTSPEGFLEFARTLPDHDLHDVIAEAEPIEDAVTYHFPDNQRRRWERLPGGPPAGFVALGDSVCSFNPIYGQGMTVAAMQALALGHHLASAGPLHSSGVMADIAAVVDVPWTLATGADAAFPTAKGRPTIPDRLASRWIPLVHAAAARDAESARTFARVQSLVAHPSTLLRPSFAWRVVTAKWRSHDEASHERVVSA